MRKSKTALLSLFVMSLAFAVSADVRVNELMASNKKTIANAAGVYADWVELFNAGSEAVDVSGWRISDNPSKSWSKWHALPEGTVIPAGGYLLVWADGVDGLVGDEVHIDVGFSASGESVCLARSEGDIVSQFDFPAQSADISYGYDAQGSLSFLDVPTPGAANGAASGEVTPFVVFSEQHGYKTAAFTLTISPAAPTSLPVYYTTDGSSPADSATRILYTGPLQISKTSVIRAAAVDASASRISVSTATYIFLADVLAQGQTQNVGANFPDETLIAPIVNGQGNPQFRQWLWYGMEQGVVSGSDAARLAQGFRDIPTLSLVTVPDGLFDAERGIYVNAQATKTLPYGVTDSRYWERSANLEMISPDGDSSKEFSVPLGIRLRGHYSRSLYYPKHSFRCFMRGEYGMSKLKFPLVGDDRTEFDKFDIRADQNHAWPNEIGNQFDQPQNWTGVNDIFARDLQRAAGRPATCGEYCHLFVNGQYWGLYQTQERLDADFLSQRLGGSEDEWSAIKSDSDGGLEAADGSTAAWEELQRITMDEGYGAAHPDNYNRVRGLDSNGLRDESLPVYVDVKNLADFVILCHWTGDVDSPVNPAIGMVNNLRMGFRSGVKGDGFKFFRHDNEHSLYQTFLNDGGLSGRVPGMRELWYEGPDINPLLWGTDRNDEGLDFSGEEDRSGITAFFTTTAQGFNPYLLHARLEENADYRVAFADRVKRLCFGNGALTPAKAEALYRARMAQIDNAIVAEAARWGNYDKPAYWGGSNRFTRDTWAAACNRVVRDFIPARTAKLVQHYRNAGWYPSFDAPEASQTEGTLNVGEKLYLSASKPIYYTTDGSDPRAPGGAVSPKAKAYGSEGITPATATVTVFARAYDSTTGEWSAKTEVELAAEMAGELSEGDLGESLRVLEVLSCTADAELTGNADDERIVLTNISSSATLDLAGVRVTSEKTGKGELSLDLVLASGTLAPNASVTLTKGADWPTQYITNGDIDIRLLDRDGRVVQVCHIEDGWFGGAADGTGRAYVAVSFDRSVDTEEEWMCEGGESTDDPPDDPPAPPAADNITTDADGFYVSKDLMGRFDPDNNWAYANNGTHDLASALAGNSSQHWHDTFAVLAGYISEAAGDFNYDGNGGEGGGFPCGRWEQSGWVLFGSTANLVVPSAGEWTISLGAAEGSDFAMSISGHGETFAMTTADYDSATKRAVKTFDFPSAGNYSFSLQLYRDVGGMSYIELSAAKGQVAASSFSTDVFALVGTGAASGTPVPVAPAITGISTSGGSMSISIGNAVNGCRYGYIFSETLEGLRTTTQTNWFANPASADGALVFELGPRPGTASGFYKLVAE